MQQRVSNRECCLGTMLFLRPEENNMDLISLPSSSSPNVYAGRDRKMDASDFGFYTNLKPIIY